MSRYIDADALIEKFKAEHDWSSIYIIEDMPTADVVEVVRCKDCKWYAIYEVKSDGTEDKRYKPSFCELYREHKKETYFCADGERRKK